MKFKIITNDVENFEKDEEIEVLPNSEFSEILIKLVSNKKAIKIS